MGFYIFPEERLKHLRPRKRHELAYIIKILFEEFAKTHAHRSNKELREGKIVNVILFGSHARGHQVEDYMGDYFSDYDLPVATNNEGSASPKI